MDSEEGGIVMKNKVLIKRGLAVQGSKEKGWWRKGAMRQSEMKR